MRIALRLLLNNLLGTKSRLFSELIATTSLFQLNRLGKVKTVVFVSFLNRARRIRRMRLVLKRLGIPSGISCSVCMLVSAFLMNWWISKKLRGWELIVNGGRGLVRNNASANEFHVQIPLEVCRMWKQVQRPWLQVFCYNTFNFLCEVCLVAGEEVCFSIVCKSGTPSLLASGEYREHATVTRCSYLFQTVLCLFFLRCEKTESIYFCHLEIPLSTELIDTLIFF